MFINNSSNMSNMFQNCIVDIDLEQYNSNFVDTTHYNDLLK